MYCIVDLFSILRSPTFSISRRLFGDAEDARDILRLRITHFICRETSWDLGLTIHSQARMTRCLHIFKGLGSIIIKAMVPFRTPCAIT
jgi:hypothetical protein